MINYSGSEHSQTEEDVFQFENFKPSHQVRELMDKLKDAIKGTDADLFQFWTNINRDPNGIMTEASERDAIFRRGFQLCGEEMNEFLPDFDAFMEFLNENSIIFGLATVERYLLSKGAV